MNLLEKYYNERMAVDGDPNNLFEVNQDILYAIIGYVDTLNTTKAKLLFDFMFSEALYGDNHPITVTEESYDRIYHDTTAFQNILDYFNNTLFPFLDQKDRDKNCLGSVSKYNKTVPQRKYNEGKYWINEIELEEIELTVDEVLYVLNRFKTIYQNAVTYNTRIYLH